MFQRIALGFLAVLCLVATSAQAQAPRTMHHLGLLSGLDAVPVADGEYNLVFNLYENNADTSPFWTETHSVQVVEGRYEVWLGSESDVDADFSSRYFLGIEFDGSEVQERFPLASVPYTMMANRLAPGSVTAEKIKDGSITSESIADGSITIDKIDGSDGSGGKVLGIDPSTGKVSWIDTPRGSEGPKGSVGPDGPQGDAGPKGDKGQTGPKGAIGDDGPAGDKGIPGPPGPKGPDGDPGETGAVGPAGPKGPVGDKGPAGPKGDPGAKGADGPTGNAGAKGPKGDPGPAGDKGPTGDRGDAGPKGPDGDQGPAGSGAGPTAVTAGLGLSGGGTTGDVTISFDNAWGDGRYLNEGQANGVSAGMFVGPIVFTDIAAGSVPIDRLRGGNNGEILYAVEGDVGWQSEFPIRAAFVHTITASNVVDIFEGVYVSVINNASLNGSSFSRPAITKLWTNNNEYDTNSYSLRYFDNSTAYPPAVRNKWTLVAGNYTNPLVNLKFHVLVP